MVKITKIYTRTGDTGSTGLVGGQRISKDAVRVDAYGDLDELNSLLGLSRTLAKGKKHKILADMLEQIQNELFDLGAIVAAPPTKALHPALPRFSQSQITRFEGWIDDLVSKLPELRSFVLPGGTLANSALHISRTVCRRAERKLVKLNKKEPLPDLVLKYVNRLSDLLFAMARYESKLSGKPEYLWKPGATTVQSTRQRRTQKQVRRPKRR